jgi:hypothetical protein
MYQCTRSHVRTPDLTTSNGEHEAWDELIDRYHRTAEAALDAHQPKATDGHQHCMACGMRWPCPVALRAAFALEL